MDSRSSWETPQNAADSFAGDRRLDRRYELQLDLKWKLIRRRRVLDSGTGHTLDLSSGGLYFEAGRDLPSGMNVELSIVWPALLHNVAPLQLVVFGRVVRSEHQRVAIHMTQHEFRTIGTQAGPRAVVSNGARPATLLASVTNLPDLEKLQ